MKMSVTIYHAADIFDESAPRTPLASLPSAQVTPAHGATVIDVIRDCGGYGFNSFALATPEIEADVREGLKFTVAAVANLAGLRRDGSLYFQSGEFVTWDGFRRAADAGVFPGDVERLVLYDFGTAGGTFFDVVEDVVEYISSWGGAVGAFAMAASYAKSFPENRRKSIAKKWRENGVIPAKVRIYVASQRHHAPEVFGGRFGLSVDEAKVVLADLSLTEGADHLWRSTEPD